LGPVVEFLHHFVAVHLLLIEQSQYGQANVAAATTTSSSSTSRRELTLSTLFAVTAPVGAVAITIAGATLEGVGVVTFRVPASPE
jgi:hypothetical protein